MGSTKCGVRGKEESPGIMHVPNQGLTCFSLLRFRISSMLEAQLIRVVVLRIVYSVTSLWEGVYSYNCTLYADRKRLFNSHGYPVLRHACACSGAPV